MKKLFIVIFPVLFSFFVKAQDKVSLPLSVDSTIIYQGVVMVDSTYKQNQLYSQAKEWFANTFKSAKEVIESDDELNGRLIGKFTDQGEQTIIGGNAIPQICEVTVEIDVKNGKYRYRFYNFNGQSTFFGVVFPINVSERYLMYLHGNFPKGAFTSKKTLYFTLDEVYSKFNLAMASIINELSLYMKAVKSDNF